MSHKHDDHHERLAVLEREFETSGPAAAGLITVLSAATNGVPVEPVSGHPDRVRIGGEVRRLRPNARERLRGWVL